jgi:hypothetical protein
MFLSKGDYNSCVTVIFVKRHTHIRMLDLFKNKLQDLSSIPGDPISLKRGLFCFFVNQ